MKDGKHKKEEHKEERKERKAPLKKKTKPHSDEEESYGYED